MSSPFSPAVSDPQDPTTAIRRKLRIDIPVWLIAKPRFITKACTPMMVAQALSATLPAEPPRLLVPKLAPRRGTVLTAA